MLARALCCFVCLVTPVFAFSAEPTPASPKVAAVEASDPAPSSDTIKPVLQAVVDEHIVAGAVVAVVDRNGILAIDSVGYASYAAKEPMRDDCLFWIASVTKSLTGTALMMLVDEGKVSLNDPVEKYLPEFQGQLIAGGEGQPALAPKHPITVREVMNHTSGLVRADSPVYRGLHTLSERVAKAAETPLLREPGTKYEYNNTGINTGGRIIEVVSGQPYAEFMQQRLFDPLGMKNTTFWPTEEQASRLARTVRRAADGKELDEIQQDKGLTPEVREKLMRETKVPARLLADMGGSEFTTYRVQWAEPAGGLYSTARDLATFCQMILNGGEYRGRRLLSAAAIRTMGSNQTADSPFSPTEGYGVGWSVKLKDDDGLSPGSFGHRGARRPAIWIDPSQGLAMIILVERFDMTGPEQKQMYGSFLRAAIAEFGQAKKD